MTDRLTTHRRDNPEELVRFVEANSDTRVARQILSFRELPDGWHYCEGRGATERAISTALKINSLFSEHGAAAIEVFPEIEGGILVSGYRDNHTIDVLCNEGGRIGLVHEIGDEVHYEQNGIDIKELVRYLRRLSWRAKEAPPRRLKSFDFCTQGISVDKEGVSKAPPSETLPETVVFQSLTRNAPNLPATPNADIFIVFTTPPFQATP